MKRVGALTALLLLLAVVLAGPAGAKATAFPPFTAPVVDTAGLVPADVESRIDAELEAYQQSTGNQIAVAVVKTTGDASLENWSIDLARKWGVGSKDQDNGVLLLVAYDDHKVRIETGRKVDDELTDLEAGRIVDDELVPLLKDGKVGAAVEQGVSSIRAQLGETSAVDHVTPVADQPSSGGAPIWVFLPIALLALAAFRSSRGRRGGGFGGFAGPMIWGGGLGGGGFGGGGGGGFGGGGFGGGGGGGFGGGGASGGW